MDDEYMNGMARLVGHRGTLVYFSLCRHANKEQQCFPSIKHMATQHGVSTDTIKRGITELKNRNVIDVQKTRTNGGTWLNNLYILLDKSEWDYKSANSTVVDQSAKLPSPECKIAPHQSANSTTKYTHNKYTHKKYSNDKSLQVAEVIKLFETVDKKNKTYYGNTTQRSACEFLLGEYGFEQVRERIAILPRSNVTPYMPRIYNPYDLKEKWKKLEDAVQSKKIEIMSKKPEVI